MSRLRLVPGSGWATRYRRVMTLDSMSLLPMSDGRYIPQIGFGVWQVPDDEVAQACRTAVSAGYRHIDTAAVYANEQGVGEAIATCGLDRDDLFITTKIWNSDHGYAEALGAAQRSLDLLGLDYVDLLLVHWPTPAQDKYEPTWRALIELRERGLTRSIGVSNFHREHLLRIIDATGVVPVLNQIELHPWLPQAQLRALHDELGILTEAWSPLGSGQLVNDPTLTAIGAQYGVTAAQVMVRWHLQLGNVVLPKSVTPERIRENIDVFGFELSPTDMASIEGLNSGRRIGPNPEEFNEA